jgi:hypothetical protein
VVSASDRSSEPSLRHLEIEEFVIRVRSRVKLNSHYVLCHSVLLKDVGMSIGWYSHIG